MAAARRKTKMTGIAVANIALSGDGWDAYMMRYCLDAAGLRESVAKDGVVEPVTVEEWRGGFRLISGFRRAAAARDAGLGELPALVHPEGALEARDAFRMALAANAPGLSLSDADRAAALRKAKDTLGFTEDELIDEVAAMVGLAPSHKVVRQYLEIAHMPHALLDALAGGEISREHAAAICLLGGGDREWFFTQVVAPLRLSAGDARLVAETALDLAGREKRPVPEVLLEVIGELEAAAAHQPNRGPAAKAALKAALARRLSPVIIEMEEEFSALVEKLAPLRGASVEHAPNFEADQVTITLRASELGQIKVLKEALERGLEDGVFEQMLTIAARKGRQIQKEIRKGKRA